MKRIISVALVVLLVASLFVACSGGSVEGTYKIKSINDKSVKEYFGTLGEALGMDVDAVLQMAGIDPDKLDELMTITLNKDGTCTASSNLDEEENGSGTWTQDGDKVTITVNDEPMEFTYKSGTLTMTVDENGQKMTMVLAK